MNTILIVGNIWQGPLYSSVYSTLCILSMGPVHRPQSEFNTFVPHNQKKKYMRLAITSITY